MRAPVIGLSRARRPLNGKITFVEVEAQALRCREALLPRAHEVPSFPRSPHARSYPQEQIPGRTIESARLHAVPDHLVGDPSKRVTLCVGRNGSSRDQGTRFVRVHSLAALEVDRSRRFVDTHDDSGRSPRFRIDGMVADLEFVRLLGVVGVAVDEGMLLFPEDALVAQVPQSVGVRDELFHGLCEEVVVPPPSGLVLAPVPIEELCEEPSRLLFLRSDGGVRGKVTGERFDTGARFLVLARLRFRFRTVLDRRAIEHDTEPALQLAAPLLEPGPELPDGETVVPIVGRDRSEDRPIGRFEPAFVLDDGEAGSGDGSFAAGHVERLDLLERVGLLRHADSLPHDGVEVHEHLASEKPIELVLPRPVTADESFERGLLVGAVVEDVHFRMSMEPLEHEVEEALEAPLLFVGRVSPERPVFGHAGHVDDGPQKVFPPLFSGPWIVLDVEKDVSSGRFGQMREPAIGLLGVRRDELVTNPTVLVLLLLQPGLLAEAVERRRHHVRGSILGLRTRESGECRDTSIRQTLGLRARDVGHAAEMVVRAPSVGALAEPAADAAVLDRTRVRGGSLAVSEQPLFKGPLRGSVVRAVVGEAVAVERPVAGQDGDSFRQDSLKLAHPMGVQTQLQQSGGLDPTGQLRIDGLVAPRAEPALAFYANEEVGMASPAPIEERCLVDDVDPRAHGFARSSVALSELLERSSRLRREANDALPFRFEAFEVPALVLPSLLLKKVEDGVTDEGSLPLPSGGPELEVGQMLASEVGDEVRGAENELAVQDLHCGPPIDRSLRSSGWRLEPKEDKHGHTRRGVPQCRGIPGVVDGASTRGTSNIGRNGWSGAKSQRSSRSRTLCASWRICSRRDSGARTSASAPKLSTQRRSSRVSPTRIDRTTLPSARGSRDWLGCQRRSMIAGAADRRKAIRTSISGPRKIPSALSMYVSKSKDLGMVNRSFVRVAFWMRSRAKMRTWSRRSSWATT